MDPLDSLFALHIQSDCAVSPSRERIRWRLILLAVGFSLLPAAAGAQQRIAYVDSEYILNQTPEYATIQQKIDRLEQQWRQELKQKQDTIAKLYREYESRELLYTEEERKQKRQAIIQAEQEMENMRQRYFGPQGELYQRQQRWRPPKGTTTYSTRVAITSSCLPVTSTT